MKKLISVAFLSIAMLVVGCSKSEPPKPYIVEGVYPMGPKQKFVYELPNEGLWMEETHSRAINNKQHVPEKIRMVRGERTRDFSERLRELYARESMDPIDFLNLLKSTDELRCTDVEFNVTKIVKNGFLYEEKASACRQFPNTFETYGKIIVTRNGMSNLQYQIIPGKISSKHLKEMKSIVNQAKVVPIPEVKGRVARQIKKKP